MNWSKDGCVVVRFRAAPNVVFFSLTGHIAEIGFLTIATRVMLDEAAP